MNITYGQTWFRAKKRLTEMWDEKRARECHDRRRLYTAVLGDSICPLCFVEVNGDYIGVGFLDSFLREYLSYQFQEVEPGRLFLTMATYREFEDGADRVRSGTTYYFKQDGLVTSENEDIGTNTRTVKQLQADVHGNWEPYPIFGRYESISRQER